jgi:hypothetical protein
MVLTGGCGRRFCLSNEKEPRLGSRLSAMRRQSEESSYAACFVASEATAFRFSADEVITFISFQS